MGAREDIVAAARLLTERGRSTFSPAELILAARETGSNYPESTLRTFVVAAMCINSPDNHAIQYRDLVRVSRGSYRLATPEERADSSLGPRSPKFAGRSREGTSSVPSPTEPYDEPASEGWSSEAKIQSSIVRHLAAGGWDITRVASTASREHGVDIEARQKDQTLLVEVKGYPDTVYRSGPKAGERKPHGVGAQARSYFAGAVLTGLLMRSDHPSAQVALAFPSYETYRTLAARTSAALAAARIDVWIVREDGVVEEGPQ